MSDRFYITQYLGNLTIMERVDHDYMDRRRVVTIHNAGSLKENEELAKEILYLLEMMDST